MASDPAPPKGTLAEGERVVAFLRRKRRENLLMAPFVVLVALYLAASFTFQLPRSYVMTLFALVALVAIPIGVGVNTRWWLTDRRLLRNVMGVWRELPLDRVAATRVTKGRLGDTVRFEDAAGNPLVAVPSVDNAAEVLQAHAGLRSAPAGGASAPAAPEGAAPETSG